MFEKESRLLRIGVVGAGPIAQAAHFEACRKARNAELYAICDLGTDCSDCGPRTAGAAETSLCTNTCHTAFDSECDDGGPNSLYSICEYGSDCADCGPR